MAALRKAVGPHATDLGLDLMGSIIGRDWNDRDAALLEEGMRLVGRDFRCILDAVPHMSKTLQRRCTCCDWDAALLEDGGMYLVGRNFRLMAFPYVYI